MQDPKIIVSESLEEDDTQLETPSSDGNTNDGDFHENDYQDED